MSLPYKTEDGRDIYWQAYTKDMHILVAEAKQQFGSWAEVHPIGIPQHPFNFLIGTFGIAVEGKLVGYFDFIDKKTHRIITIPQE